MSGYANPPSINPYWYYESHGYQPNTSVSFNGHDSVVSPPHQSFDMYNNRFVDSGYLSRTPTPPTPVRHPSPGPFSSRNELDAQEEVDGPISEKSVGESKPRLPYVKRTRIQYTMQQLQILEEAFQNNHYPEVTTVDALAELLDVRHEKISIWFQNRRSRFKRQQKPKASSSSSSSTITPSATKKLTHPPSMSSAAPSPAYDPSASYYPSYFWPSPIVDNRAPPSYPNSHQNSSFYESYGNTSTNSMWNSTNTAYSSPASWHQSPTSTMNLSLTSSPSPVLPLLPEHLSSM